MKRTIIIAALLLSTACWGQEKPDFWHNFTVGTEFCHTVEQSYEYGKGIFRNHPNNSANLIATYDLGRVWTLGAYVGYYNCHRNYERWDYRMYQPENGTSSSMQLVNGAFFSFGLEATVHVLPLMYKERTPFDLTLNARVGRRPQDMDWGLGIGLGYRPLEWLTLYGKAYYGSFGFPNGMQDSGVHSHLVCGVNFRPF